MNLIAQTGLLIRLVFTIAVFLYTGCKSRTYKNTQMTSTQAPSPIKERQTSFLEKPLREAPSPVLDDEEIFKSLPLENQKLNEDFLQEQAKDTASDFAPDSGIESKIVSEVEIESEEVAEPSQQAVTEDSSLNPEELGEYIWGDSNLESLGNSGINLCDGNIYLDDWHKDFDSQWLKQNGKKYKSESLLKVALQEARSEEFLKLLVPALADKGFDFPVVINQAVVSWMRYFQTRGRKAFELWMSRSAHVLPIVRPVLEKHGLPQDLVYLAMIESGFNYKAKSFASAVGLWQFMRPTGKLYGLRVSDYVDERRNPEKATLAAAQYLTYLYGLFGDWHLAAASYNAGEGRVARALRSAGGSTNFFGLSEAKKLPNETRNYVPKLIAAMVLSKNPQVFGFEGTQGSVKNVSSEVVLVSRSVSLTNLSSELKLKKEDLENLNPELRIGMTPPLAHNQGKPYPLKVPLGYTEKTVAALMALPEAPKTYRIAARVKRRELITVFTKRAGLQVKDFLEANPKLVGEKYLTKGLPISLPVRLGSGQVEKLMAASEKSAKKSIKKKYASRKLKVLKIPNRSGKLDQKSLLPKTKGSKKEVLLKKTPGSLQLKVKPKIQRAEVINIRKK
jgi:membrane-bound lytic murein transglycosylase D